MKWTLEKGKVHLKKITTGIAIYVEYNKLNCSKTFQNFCFNHFHTFHLSYEYSLYQWCIDVPWYIDIPWYRIE